MIRRITYLTTAIFIFGFILPLALSLTGLLGCDYKSDFTEQEVAFIYEFKRMLSTGSPWWSWDTYLGDNFIGGYSYYCLFSPFTWFCCLFPFKYLNIGILISIYLKTVFTGIFAGMYLRRMNVSDNMSVLGGILYVFSSFYIINLFYGMFCEAIMIFPLLLIGIENVLDRRSYSIPFLSLITFITIVIQYYFAVSSLICAGIYLICRISCVQRYRSAKNLITPIIAILCGVIMSAIVLIPTAMHIIGGNKTHLEPLGNLYSIFSFALYHVFWSIIPKVSERLPESFPYGSLNSTSLFIQIVGLSLAIAYVAKKRTWLSMCLTIYAILYLTPLNGIFSLFTMVSYCRWLYCFILMIILASVRCLDEKIFTKRDINIYLIISSCLVVLSVMLAFYFQRHISLNSRQTIELALGAASLAALWWLSRTQTRLHKYITPMVVVSSIFNLTVFTVLLTGDTSGRKNLLNDFIINRPLPLTTQAVSHRCDFTRSTYTNLSQMYGIPSLSCFHSLCNKNAVDFVRYVKEAQMVAITIPIETPRESLASLLSVKEVIRFDSDTTEGSDYNFGLTFEEKLGRHDKYSFDYYIPMGMVYNSYVTRSQLDSLRNADKEADLCLMMLDNIVIEDCDEAEIGKVLRKSAINTDITLDSITTLRRQHTTDFKGTSKGYTITTRPDTPEGMVFISTPRDEGFTATIDGELTKIYRVNMGMSGIMVPAGKHTIESTYLAPGLKLGAIISGVMMAMLLIYTLISYRRYKCQRDTQDGSSSH